MDYPVKVLHITEKLQAAGIESFIMNVYRNIDKSSVHFDFLVTRDEKEFYDEEIKSLGGKKFTIDIDKNTNTFIRILKESKELYKLLKVNDYQIVHVHSGTPLRVFYLFAAKLAGTKGRIYHSHSAEVKGPHSNLSIKKNIFRCLKQLFKFSATDYFACSKAAGEWMYTKRTIDQGKVKVLYNGIELDKFRFNKEVREKYRKEMNINDKLVIGHIGRFNHQKNHTFLIDIFNEVYKQKKDSKLLLIGIGDLQDEIRMKVESLGLSDAVEFLNVRADVNNIMQAMDVFLLPSNYEGLPVVGVEAQAAGLKVIVSDNITDEIVITDNIKLVSLSKSAEEWSNIILNEIDGFERVDVSNEIIKNGYNAEDVAKYIQKTYLESVM